MLTDRQMGALKALVIAENLMLITFGWTDLGKGQWKPPPGYLSHKRVEPGQEYPMDRGHAINSQKARLFGLGGPFHGQGLQDDFPGRLTGGQVQPLPPPDMRAPFPGMRVQVRPEDMARLGEHYRGLVGVLQLDAGAGFWSVFWGRWVAINTLSELEPEGTEPRSPVDGISHWIPDRLLVKDGDQ